MNQKRIIFLVGPTGVGKSAVALQMAESLNAEIVSCDAMLVYREVAIANDKPTPEERKRVMHHMIDCVSVTEDFDVARYRKEAIEVIEDIHKRGKVPLIVGGSGMYVTILLDGIFEANNEDPALRRQLQEDAKILGVEKLYLRLKKVDPVSAERINARDERRIVRALEVYVSNRKPISQLQKERSGLWGKYYIKILALTRERQELYDRVNQRVDQMFERGLIQEVKRLNQLTLSRTAGGLIGLPEVNGFLQGKFSIEETKELMKMNTRHYVKRQLTWFRKEKRLDWVTVNADQSAGDIAVKLIEFLR
jgi:tRNA dimethylallyltransferase